MRLVIVSGLSGSGKSVALSTLEDDGFYCIDNLPPGLLVPLIEELRGSSNRYYERVAVGVDARSDAHELARLPDHIDRLLAMDGVRVDVVFLRAERETLLRRYSETRRRHPLSQSGRPLADAIDAEQELLAPLVEQADLTIETTHRTLHELRALLRERLLPDESVGLSLLFQSFGFKHGLPADTDFVFDVRCLPNPHWQPHLRALTGRDRAVIDYLENDPGVQAMQASIEAFLGQWLPSFETEGRAYMTVSLGCTGGQHRSVYLAEQLRAAFADAFASVSVRHRELRPVPSPRDNEA